MATKGSSPDRATLEKIAEWAKAEPGIDVAPNGTLTVSGNTPITVVVTVDDERVQLTNQHTELVANAPRIEAVRGNLPGRGSGVTGAVAATGTRMDVTLTSTLYIDGLTRQGFVAALNELVAATDRAVGSVPSAIVETPAATVATPAPAAAAITIPADSAPTMVMSAVWAPTHRVPDGGLRAWPNPDPAVEPIATLQPRVELSVAERRGDWARVIGSNGWTGWVDARRLQAMTGGSPRAASAASGGFPLGALGAIALIAAAFLPWFDLEGFDSSNSFDVALKFLWDITASGDPALGFAVAGLGALGLLAAFIPGVPDGLRRLAGVGGLVVAGLFAFQVHRGIDTTVSDTIDALGFGVYIALAGAVVMLISPKAKSSA